MDLEMKDKGYTITVKCKENYKIRTFKKNYKVNKNTASPRWDAHPSPQKTWSSLNTSLYKGYFKKTRRWSSLSLKTFYREKKNILKGFKRRISSTHNSLSSALQN